MSTSRETPCIIGERLLILPTEKAILRQSPKPSLNNQSIHTKLWGTWELPVESTVKAINLCLIISWIRTFYSIYYSKRLIDNQLPVMLRRYCSLHFSTWLLSRLKVRKCPTSESIIPFEHPSSARSLKQELTIKKFCLPELPTCFTSKVRK
jgi:hypothetical protein